MALFAFMPVLLGNAGRLADRLGYHRPVRLAVALAAAAALAARLHVRTGPGPSCCSAWRRCWSAPAPTWACSIQRTAGMTARQRRTMRVFSWLGDRAFVLNVVGPVAVGLMIDLAGFAAAYGLILMLPLATLAAARRAGDPAPGAAPAGGTAWKPARHAGMKRAAGGELAVRDVLGMHTFAVPSWATSAASALPPSAPCGTFTLAVTAIRVFIRCWRTGSGSADWLRLALTAAVFSLYPFAHSPG